MKILVIGGTLFIGRETVQRLVTRGHEVTVLHRRAAHDLGPAIGNAQADRSDVATVSRIVQDGGFDVVVGEFLDIPSTRPSSKRRRACSI